MNHTAICISFHSCDIFVGKFFSRVQDLTVLAIHVGNIFGISSDPQVIWVDTQRRIATVANAHAFRDIALKHHVRGAVRKIGPASIFNLPVSSVVLPSVQNATIGTFLHPRLKSLFQGYKQFRRTFLESIGHACFAAKLLPSCNRWRSHKHKGGFAMNASEITCGHLAIISQSKNGGLNGYADRVARYEAALDALA